MWMCCVWIVWAAEWSGQRRNATDDRRTSLRQLCVYQDFSRVTDEQRTGHSGTDWMCHPATQRHLVNELLTTAALSRDYTHWFPRPRSSDKTSTEEIGACSHGIKARTKRRNWTELNWHGLVCDKLTNKHTRRAHWSLVDACASVVT